MSRWAKLDADVLTLRNELAAIRARLVQYKRSPEDGAEALVTAFALSTEVKRLCASAALSQDRTRSEALLARVSNRLNELQKVLGAQ